MKLISALERAWKRMTFHQCPADDIPWYAVPLGAIVLWCMYVTMQIGAAVGL